MKIYLKYNKIISEKTTLLTYKEKNFDQIFSNEGIYIYNFNNRKIFKLIVENDNVYELEDLIVDDSKVNYIECMKIPLKYKENKINEKIYKIDEKIEFIVVNNSLCYFICDDLNHFKNSYIEICNKVFI
jgi:hypothetical protein